MYQVTSKELQVSQSSQPLENVKFPYYDVFDGVWMLNIYIELTITSDESVDEMRKATIKRLALHFLLYQ